MNFRENHKNNGHMIYQERKGAILSTGCYIESRN